MTNEVVAATIGATVTAVGTLVYNLYSKNKEAAITASEHAFTMLKRIVDEQQDEIKSIKVSHFSQIESIHCKVDKLTEDHIDCLKKNANLEARLIVLENGHKP